MTLQVRSAACRGCGRVVGALPECSKPYLPDLWPLWIAHTDDNIPSVREDAAIALGDAALGLHQDALSIILPHLRHALLAALLQATFQLVLWRVANLILS